MMKTFIRFDASARAQVATAASKAGIALARKFGSSAGHPVDADLSHGVLVCGHHVLRRSFQLPPRCRVAASHRQMALDGSSKPWIAPKWFAPGTGTSSERLPAACQASW